MTTKSRPDDDTSSSGVGTPIRKASKDTFTQKDTKELGVPLDELRKQNHRYRWWKRNQIIVDLDSTATQPSVFDDSKTLEIYRPPASYENAHRFDPDARWTWREEKNLVRKIDWRIMLWACIMFFCLDLDRSNISQANTDNFLDDLGLSTNDFNLGNTLFRCSFLAAELPSQLISKRLGPDVWIPTSNYREEIIMVNRVLRDDPSKSDMHNREGLSPKMIWNSLCDWHMWPLYVLGLVHMMPVGPPQTYLTLSLRKLGFNTTEANLLSIPSVVIGIITMLFTSFLSEAIDSRVLATVVLQIWALPLLVALYTFDRQTSQWAYFSVVTLVTGFPYIHPIQVAWASRNSYSVRTRTVSASVYNMFVQAGAVVYANIYRADDQPYGFDWDLLDEYVLYGLVWLFYRTVNKKRDKIWNSWSKEEQTRYLENTNDKGNKRLDFRFAY
ncbi:major facilitator superfamily transporter [Rhizoctonia solani]|uniref:Major facilitator superfamily transporter n=1 Tax=Rhizoctonia solani TaxID=456999 RepID=A0A8H8NVK1_9AGAM|nr:major facilitator superfamily transporter [Rhizoctonia solani]QRW20320.1 major facilitator superfamily transporter [Rhizoctonia solani]